MVNADVVISLVQKNDRRTSRNTDKNDRGHRDHSRDRRSSSPSRGRLRPPQSR